MGVEAIAGLVIIMMVAALGLIVLGYRRANQDIVIEERLSQYGHQRVQTLEELEMQLPFQERVLIPIFRRLSAIGERLTPSNAVDKIRQDLAEAGSPSGIGPKEYAGIRVFASLGLGGITGLLFILSDMGALMAIGLTLVTVVVGYMMPRFWISRRISQRKSEIQKALPDAIDLLTISVESGLGFDPALARVVDKWDNELTREFGRMLSDVRLGSSRRQAMRQMAERINVDDLNVFTSSLIQADQLGVSISQVLRIQSQQMRMRRRQRAEEQAHKAPIKMLFPMVFLIFPAIYIVLLGPAVPRLLDSFQW
jgi:tight adherence protein C